MLSAYNKKRKTKQNIKKFKTKNGRKGKRSNFYFIRTK